MPEINEMINKLSNRVEDWDLDELVGFAKQTLEEHFGCQDEATIREEYEFFFGDDEVDNE